MFLKRPPGFQRGLSLRLRLTLWYAVTLAITLLLMGGLLFLVLQRSLGAGIDQALEARAREVNGTLRVVVAYPGLRVQLPDVDAFSAPGVYLQVADPDGKIVATSGTLGRQQLPASASTLHAALDGQATLETVEVGTEQLRMYTAPLVVGGRITGLLQVAQSLREMDDTLSQLQLIMFAGGVLSVWLSALVGWFLARAALHPVRRVAATAASISSSGDLDKRVHYQGPPDEIGQLAATFNHMLDRLGSAYTRLEGALAAQRRFVADASHELRTPLTTIRGNAALLGRFPDMDGPERDETVRQMTTEAERMSRLVADLLMLARADAGQAPRQAVVDLDQVVDEVVRQAASLPGGAKVHLGRLQAARVTGDPDYLKQLALILVDNGIRYTGDDGVVEVELTTVAGQARLAVSDNGIGIGPEDLPHIFDRFYRADRSRGAGGTGLGLAIARWIAEQHGGALTVESTLGVGSAFTFRIGLQDEGEKILAAVEREAAA